MALEERLQIQEDIQEIIRLKASYCNAADCGWSRPSPDGDMVAKLFVPEGVWNGGAFGQAAGHEAIRALFTSLKDISFAFHCITNPIIKVNGDEATGTWHLLSPGTMAANQSIWIGGTYNDEFVRTPEGWKLKNLSLTVAFTGTHEQGWDVSK